MINIIYLLKEFYRNNISKYKNLSYSQEGEDRILSRYFEGRSTGFYVDIGAHHPFRFSNTYLFYKNNWRGINIEANPDALQLFKKYRKFDINLNCAIGNSSQELEFYKFAEPALNTFNRELAAKRLEEGWKQKEIIKLNIKKLENILEENLPKDQKIDFFSIDVEGLDLEVLLSNNWNKFSPELVLVEKLNDGPIESDPIYLFMQEKNYCFLSKSINTMIFKKIK